MSDLTSYKAHEWLERFYSYLLLYAEEGGKAKEYLLNRGLTEETIEQFGLGFSPFKSKMTIDFLLSKGFNMKQLLEWKVLNRQKNGNVNDLFRGRITFPIRDFRGRTVSFGGRAISDNARIKYFNSATTDIYSKSDNLFGLDVAKEHIKTTNYAVLVEGYFDVLMSHQGGLKNTVGALGTALTVNQALLIKSVTDNIVIAFDGDSAGMENAFRSASVLKSVGCNVKIATIPDEADPDDFIRKHGGETFQREVINASQVYEDALFDYEQSKYDLSSLTDRFSFTETVLKELSTENIQNNEKLLERLKMTLNIPLEHIERLTERGK